MRNSLKTPTLANTKNDLLDVKQANTVNYTIIDMQLAVELMSYDAREYGGEITPKYTQWSNLLNIPKTTLYEWWQKREEIMESGSLLGEQLPLITARKMQSGILQAIEILQSRFDKMSTRDLLDYIKTVFPIQRLLTGKSTQNVSKSISYTPPNPAGPKKKK